MENQSSSLEQPCDEIPVSVIPLQDWEGSEKLFSGKAFFEFLNLQVGLISHLWVMSYTASESLILHIPIKKLLIEKGSFKANEIVFGYKIHTKLYLAFDDKDVKFGFIGSQNLVAPTLTDLMIEVPKNKLPFLKKYFLHYFNQFKNYGKPI